MQEHLEEVLSKLISSPSAESRPLASLQLSLQPSDESFSQLAKELKLQKLAEISDEPPHLIRVLDPKQVGPQRLIRRFCARQYGRSSPLIDRKMTQAILNRNGANHDLENPLVQQQLQSLADEGLIRILGREEAYIKILGAE
jgi:hypothetical protein